MRLITTALVLAALGVLLLPTVSAGQEGRLTGSLPRDGGIALAVWGGGPIEELVLEAGAGGCSTVSVWTTPEGEGFVGYIPTVVEAVNARFFETYSGGVLPPTPVLIVCQAGEPLVPELEVSGLTFDILDFGESCVGCIVERVVGLRNVGTAATRIHDIRVTSAFGDEGAFVVGAGCVGVTLAPGAACSFPVTFTARDASHHFATILVDHSGPGSPLGIGASGDG